MTPWRLAGGCSLALALPFVIPGPIHAVVHPPVIEATRAKQVAMVMVVRDLAVERGLDAVPEATVVRVLQEEENDCTSELVFVEAAFVAYTAAEAALITAIRSKNMIAIVGAAVADNVTALTLIGSYLALDNCLGEQIE